MFSPEVAKAFNYTGVIKITAEEPAGQWGHFTTGDLLRYLPRSSST